MAVRVAMWISMLITELHPSLEDMSLVCSFTFSLNFIRLLSILISHIHKTELTKYPVNLQIHHFNKCSN